MNPQDIVAKWAKNTKASTASWLSGIQRVKSAPGEAAAARADAYLSGVQKSVADGSYQRGCRSMGLSEWQSRCQGKSTNIVNGVTAAESRVLAYQTKMVPVYEQIKQAVKAMPKGTMEDGLERVRYAMMAMKSANGKA